MAKTLVTWSQPGSENLTQVLLDVDFNGVANIPLFFGSFEDTPNNLVYNLSFHLLGSEFHPSFNSYTLGNLSIEEAERLTWFTDRIPAIQQAMADALSNAQASSATSPPPSVSGIGQKFFRFVEFYRDSDGDGLFDHHEFALGGDPWLTDSDHDGYSDYFESIAASALNDSGSTPQNPSGGGGMPSKDPEADDDMDGKPNGIDVDPDDVNVDWAKSGFPRFMILPIPNASARTLVAVNNNGEVVMNKPSDSPSYWKVGETTLHVLSIESPDITHEEFTQLDAQDNPQTTTQIYKPISAEVTDINDKGQIVGNILYTENGLSPYHSDYILIVAAKWANAESVPIWVNPVQKTMGNYGDLLLNSNASAINQDETILGKAEYPIEKTDPDPNEVPFSKTVNVSTIWSKNQLGQVGQYLYDPETSPNPFPFIKGIYELGSEFYGATFTEANNVTIASSAYWDSWKTIPTKEFTPTEAGTQIIDIGTVTRDVPLGSKCLLGEHRLMLRDRYTAQRTPALRTHTGGFALGDGGTIWRYNDESEIELWHPLDRKTLMELTSSSGYDMQSIADVTARNVAIGETENSKVILLPVYVALLPEELPYVTDKDWVYAEEMKIAKFKGGVLMQGSETASNFDFQNDPDRFRLAVVGFPDSAALKAAVKTKNLTALQADYDDSVTSISYTYSPLLKAHITEPMFLTSNDVDDDASGNSIGADNSPEDRSHKIALGGKFAIDKIQVVTGQDTKVYDANVEYFVSEKASVTVTIYPVNAGALPPFPVSEIEKDVKAAKECYAQIGLKLNVTIGEHLSVPSFVMVANENIPLNLADGLDFPITLPGTTRPPLTDEEMAFFTAVASTSTDDIQIFYIDKFSVAGNQNSGIKGFADRASAFDPGVFANTIVLQQNRFPFVLAHELGHLLLNDGSHEGVRENLMSTGREYQNTLIDDPKRLNGEQQKSILSSPLLDSQ